MGSVAPSRPSVPPSREHDDTIELVGLSYGTYRELVVARDASGRRFPRITFCEGRLRLVSPSSRHEQAKRYLEDLLRDWTLARGIELVPLGATTQQHEGRAGAEPDTSYQVGTGVEGDRPDFVVKVEHRNPLTQLSFDAYEALAVPEVWWLEVAALELLRDEGAEARPLRIYVLGRGGYVENDARRSDLLPELDPGLLARAVLAALDHGPMAGRAVVLDPPTEPADE